MEKVLITTKQAISILIMFLLGTALVLTPGSEAGQDVWIVILLALIISIPVYGVYGRILYLFPNKDLYTISNELFGAVVGKIITLLYIWYSIHLGALVLRNFSEFIQIVSFANTPQVFTIIVMGITCIIFCKSGIEAIGRWSSFMLPLIIIIYVATVFFSLPKMNFQHLKPILYEGMKPVMSSVFTVLAFPILEAVLFIGVFDTLKKTEKIYKVFLGGLLISGFLGIITNVKNILTLGADLTQLLYFPTYTSVKLIDMGNLIERVEVTVAIILILGGIIKLCVCIIVASKGIASFLSFGDHKSIIVPVTLVMMTLSSLLYSNVMEMFYWAKNIYQYYAIPFQLILPFLIYGVAELRARKEKAIIPKN